jgi:hypothetical protein
MYIRQNAHPQNTNLSGTQAKAACALKQNVHPAKHAPVKTRTRKNVHPAKHASVKTRTRKNVHPAKHASVKSLIAVDSVLKLIARSTDCTVKLMVR